VENPSVDSKIYDADYYLQDAFGGDMKKFIDSLEQPPVPVQYALKVAQVKPGERILDIGCGLGRLVYLCAKAGCVAHGYDYSDDAIAIAQKVRESLPESTRSKVVFKKDDVKNIPETEKYDVIFMTDVVEHLYDWELKVLFSKLARILKPGSGRLVIHTMPNKWQINIIFPLKRMLSFPKTLKSGKGFFYKRNKYFYDSEMHVNEQTPASMKRHLSEFDAKVWCEEGSSNVLSILTKKWCGTDIWAVAR
jgi:SAM-dependent methyltransferase